MHNPLIPRNHLESSKLKMLSDIKSFCTNPIESKLSYYSSTFVGDGSPNESPEPWASGD
jgi:hypothetical protein